MIFLYSWLNSGYRILQTRIFINLVKQVEYKQKYISSTECYNKYYTLDIFDNIGYIFLIFNFLRVKELLASNVKN